MPKYSQIKAKDLVKLLIKLWYEKHTQVWSHLTLKSHKNGKRITIPIHNKPLWKWLLNAILKQSWLDKSILDNL